MKKYMNVIGIVSVAACALSYPAYLLYKYIANRGKNELEEDVVKPVKHLFTSRKKHNLHHRHADASTNGLAGHQPA